MPNWEQLLQLAPLALMKPGSPEGAAFMQGYLQSKQRMEQEQQQAARQQSDEQYRQAQLQNMEADNARANAALGLQYETADLNRIQAFRQDATTRAGQVEATATDPVAGNLGLARELTGMAGAYWVPPSAGAGIAPNLNVAVSSRQKKRAADLYAQAEKRFGPEAMATNAITIQTEEFGPITPSALRMKFEAPAFVTPSPGAVRPDGTLKGQGFLGPQRRPDGSVSSEISIGVNIDGREMEIPTLVPTLTLEERQWLLMNDIADPRAIPKPIIDKAIAHARKRIAGGLSPFADSSATVPATPFLGKATFGSFEDFMLATPERQQRILAGRKQYQQADDRPQTGATVVIQTVDSEGAPITRIVPKTAGSEFAARPPAASGLGSAQAQIRNQRAAAALNQVERLRQLAPVRTPGPKGMLEGAAEVAKGYAGLSTKTRQFQALLQPTAMLIAVAIQGAANLSDTERKAMSDMLGSISTMDYESQMALLDQATDLLKNAADVEQVGKTWRAAGRAKVAGAARQPTENQDGAKFEILSVK